LSDDNERVYLYDPYAALCPKETCLIYDKETEMLLYRDDDHLSVEASVTLTPHFSKWFERNLSHSPSTSVDSR
jgi:hypothetical protein